MGTVKLEIYSWPCVR